MTQKKRAVCVGCPAYRDPCLWSGAGNNPAHLIVIGPGPSGFSVGNRTPFYGKEGRLFKRLMELIRRYNNGRYVDTQVYYTYAVLAGAYSPTAKHIENCSSNLMREIGSIRGVGGRNPVIVTLGPIATKAVGIKAKKISAVVGRELTVNIVGETGNRPLTVIPLLSMKHLMAKPGTGPLVIESLLKAVILAHGESAQVKPFEEVAANYVYPKTIEEVERLVDDILGYYDAGRNSGPENWAISLDTETNTLYPYTHPDPKTLMLSVAWDEGKAATILLDHPETPYDAKQAWKHVTRLLQSPKPKAFHNWKFDKKFLENVSGVRVNRVVWDTILGEHYIDEDKKGYYGLKQLTPIYAAGYQGYDDTLHAILRGNEEIADEEEDDDADNSASEVEALVLSDEEVVDRSKLLGCPAGRDVAAWEGFVRDVIKYTELRNVQKKKRTPEQQAHFDRLGKSVKQYRKELKIEKPVKKPKKSAAKVDGGFESIPLETILTYAAADADVTRIILRAQMARLANTDQWDEATQVMKYLYLPASRTLSDMEWTGFKVDVNLLDRLIEDVGQRMNAAKEVIASKFDPTVNINAPQQVAELMAKMNFEAIPGEEAGGTGKDILAKYEKMYPEDDPRHVFCSKILEYREVSKVLSTYLKPIKKRVVADGKIHCKFNINGTSSGRLSSSDINMQNLVHIAARRIKKDDDGNTVVVHPGYNIKSLFVPEDPRNVIVNVDIKGAELRVYTAYSNDDIMIEAIKNGMDIHSLVTSKVYKIPYDEIQAKKETDPDIKKKRTNCKRIVFGILYGAGPWKLSQQIESTIEEAEELQNFLFTEFPAIKQYVTQVTRQVETQGFVQTYFGRRRRFRLAHVDHKLMGEAKREAVNFLIQSTSSDLVVAQLCEIAEHLPEIGGKMLITVHDSYTMEVPEKNVHLLPGFMNHWITERVAEKYDWLPVPFLYDIEVGPTYGNLEPLHV